MVLLTLCIHRVYMCGHCGASTQEKSSTCCNHFLGPRLGSVNLTVAQRRSLRHQTMLLVTIHTTKQLQMELCKTWIHQIRRHSFCSTSLISIVIVSIRR